jgi:RNA polymerase sigma factor (sigma-70 family)
MNDPDRRAPSAPPPAPVADVGTRDRDLRLADVVSREQPRLRNFIRRRVADPLDAEDVLQDVLYAFVEANRLVMPIEHVTGWLYRVARNRITDLFRKRRREDRPQLDDLLASVADGPDAHYARSLLIDALGAALAELPKEQREVFLAHEFQGCTFQEMAARTGVSVNTLLSRKRYAVQRLRKRLQRIHDDYMDARS